MTMKIANEIAVAYTQKYERFLKHEEQLLELVRGTFLEQEMKDLSDQVEEALELCSATIRMTRPDKIVDAEQN